MTVITVDADFAGSDGVRGEVWDDEGDVAIDGDHRVARVDAPTNNSQKKNKKNLVSQLALDTFEAFKPFINTFDCGLSWQGSPFHLITKADWQFFRRHKEGERGLVYPDGRKFHPYRDIIQNIYNSMFVHRHME